MCNILGGGGSRLLRSRFFFSFDPLGLFSFTLGTGIACLLFTCPSKTRFADTNEYSLTILLFYVGMVISILKLMWVHQFP